jgi:DNA polymerase-3 subunit gamma/tau
MSNTDFQVADKWANKWRPKTFDSLVGQADAVAYMKGIIKTKQVPSALLFHGPFGCGKTTSARLLAKYLNCKTLDACGKCSSCKYESHHPDIMEMNAATSRSIDDVRALIDKAKFLPRHNFRVFILDEIHQWTSQSIEAFLKPLEEPPPKTIYMLCTSEVQKIKGTVISRCTPVPIALPDRKAIKKRLVRISEKEGTGLDDKVLEACVEGSGGHVRDAISLLESSYIKSKGDPNLSTKELVKFVSKAGTQESSRVAIKVLLGLYLNKPKVVAKAVFDMSEPIPTVNAMLRMNEYYLATTLFEGNALPPNVWHTADNRLFVEHLTKNVSQIDVKDALSVERLLTTTRARMQEFAVPERSLILSSLTGERR